MRSMFSFLRPPPAGWSSGLRPEVPAPEGPGSPAGGRRSTRRRRVYRARESKTRAPKGLYVFDSRALPIHATWRLWRPLRGRHRRHAKRGAAIACGNCRAARFARGLSFLPALRAGSIASRWVRASGPGPSRSDGRAKRAQRMRATRASRGIARMPCKKGSRRSVFSCNFTLVAVKLKQNHAKN